MVKAIDERRERNVAGWMYLDLIFGKGIVR